MKLSTGTRTGLGVAATLLLATALVPNLSGQQLSLSEANAVCGARFNTFVRKNSQTAGNAELTALQLQRERNQSKVAVGMTEDDVIQLLGPPDHAGAAWLDSAQTLCIWRYEAIRQPAPKGSPTYRNLEITMNLNREVVAVQFQEPMFRPSDTINKTEH